MVSVLVEAIRRMAGLAQRRLLGVAGALLGALVAAQEAIDCEDFELVLWSAGRGDSGALRRAPGV